MCQYCKQRANFMPTPGVGLEGKQHFFQECQVTRRLPFTSRRHGPVNRAEIHFLVGFVVRT